jgi:phosphatidylinositol-3-phosphatase
MFRAIGSLAVTAVLAVLLGCGSGISSTSSNNGGNSGGSGSSVQHVVIVMLENQSYADVIGSPSMPYFNQLANQYSLAAQFYADVHPSLGNYLMMTAGQDPTIGTSDPDNWMGTISAANVASALTSAGKTWKAYAQSLPSTGYTGTDQYPYVKHHNPFAYFSSVLGDPAQTAKIVPLAQFSNDMNSGSLPNYSLVIPDDEHNGHDCSDGTQNCANSERLSEADNFLQSTLSPLFSNSSLLPNTVVIVAYDEAAVSDRTNGGGHIPVIIAGGPIKTAYQSTSTYQFQSLLRFSLTALGVNSYPGASSSAADMTEFLK